MSEPTRVVLYLGAIDEAEQPAAEAVSRAEIYARGIEITDVRWDTADQLDVDPLDRPVFGELILDVPSEVKTVLADSASEDRDPLLQEFFDDMKRPAPTCARCGGRPVLLVGLVDGEAEEVCPACDPDHPASVRYREYKAEENG